MPRRPETEKIKSVIFVESLLFNYRKRAENADDRNLLRELIDHGSGVLIQNISRKVDVEAVVPRHVRQRTRVNLGHVQTIIREHRQRRIQASGDMGDDENQADAASDEIISLVANPIGTYLLRSDETRGIIRKSTSSGCVI